MRPSPFASAVTKLYAIIDADQLQANEEGERSLIVSIDGTHDYSSKRRLILTQTSAFGSKEETETLAKILLGSGAALFVAFVLFVFAWIYQKRRLANDRKTPKGTGVK